jgi:hypothetical protein
LKIKNENRLRARSEDYGLFSLAGLVWSDLRKSMLPSTLEMILFLRVNARLWDMTTIADIIRSLG